MSLTHRARKRTLEWKIHTSSPISITHPSMFLLHTQQNYRLLLPQPPSSMYCTNPLPWLRKHTLPPSLGRGQGRALTLALEQLAAAAIVATILQPTNSPQVSRYADIIARARDLRRWRPELPAGFTAHGILGFGALFSSEYLLITTGVEGEALGQYEPFRGIVSTC